MSLGVFNHLTNKLFIIESFFSIIAIIVLKFFLKCPRFSNVSYPNSPLLPISINQAMGPFIHTVLTCTMCEKHSELMELSVSISHIHLFDPVGPFLNETISCTYQ